MLGIGLSLMNAAVADRGFSASALFAAGEQGFWFDPSDLSSMYQDSTGTTTPAVVDGPVGYIRDKSGRGNHATQTTDANRPTLRLASGLYYLEFDGTNDSLVTPTITLADAVTICAGVNKTSDASARLVLAAAGGEQIALFAPSSAAANYAFKSFGSAGGAVVPSASSFAAPDTAVLTGQGKISTDVCTLRRNGVQVATTGADQGTGNYAAVAYHLGKRSSSTLFHSGRVYGILMLGRPATAAEITAMEAQMAARSGVTL
jgi:hypothetical protein